MKTFSKIILAFLSTSLFFSCENPNPKFNQLPPITTEGKGTFGYKVNGEVKGQCYDGLFTGLAKAEIVGDSTFKLHESCDSHSFGFFLYFDALEVNKKYTFDNGSGVTFSKDAGDFREDFQDTNFNLELLKVDANKKIIAGIFSGTLFNETGESVEITDGRFDLIYKEY